MVANLRGINLRGVTFSLAGGPPPVSGVTLKTSGLTYSSTYTSEWPGAQVTSTTAFDSGTKGTALTLASGDTIAVPGTAPASVLGNSLISPSSNIYMWEYEVNTTAYVMLGIFGAGATYSANDSTGLGTSTASDGPVWYGSDGTVFSSNSAGSTVATFTTGDIVGIVYDMNIGYVGFYLNGVIQTSVAVASSAYSTGAYIFLGSFYTQVLPTPPSPPVTSGIVILTDPGDMQYWNTYAADFARLAGTPTTAWDVATLGTNGTIVSSTTVQFSGTGSVLGNAQTLSSISNQACEFVINASYSTMAVGYYISAYGPPYVADNYNNGSPLGGGIDNAGNLYGFAGPVGTPASWGNGDIIGMVYNGGAVYFYKNGVAQGSISVIPGGTHPGGWLFASRS